MSVRNLDKLFAPKSVAAIGASNRPHSVGSVVMRNLLDGGFDGPVMPVNPRQTAVHGVLCYPDVNSLPLTPDMALICTPPRTVPGLIRDLAERGTRAAVVLTAGLHEIQNEDGLSLQDEMLAIAKPHQFRIFGPNCLGLIVPGIGLNASFSPSNALPGRIAFAGQSGGLTTAILDYANSNGIGFSHFMSVGNIVDVDFGDVLDYLAGDAATSSILLYIEGIKEPREFMSAARAAARNKPVLVIKSGRVPEAAKAAMSHTDAMAGSDDVYDTAFRRAGMLRVYELEELFDAAQTLARSKPLRGDRLAILTNGGGPGVMATDALMLNGGRLAELSEETLAALDAVMPSTWSRGNPVDIIGDAPPELYRQGLEILRKDPGVDAILVMHVPVAVTDNVEAAKAVIEACGSTSRNVLTTWLGGNIALEARRLFGQAGIPTYFTPDRAIRGFMHMVHYQRNQELLNQTPSAPAEFTPAISKAHAVVRTALDAGREVLTEAEAKEVLAQYEIPVVRTRIVASPDEAVKVAEEFGYPVAVKIHSTDISHKSDVGGVALDLESADDVRRATEGMLARIPKLLPDAEIEGFTVQQMARRLGAHELIIGVTMDPTFGPVILVGQGGKAVEVVKDRAVGLPPLNMHLARTLLARTRIWKLLQGFRDEPAADIDAICEVLVKVSELVTDLAEVIELDINPLFADHQGVLALDARMRLRESAVTGRRRLSIRAYPSRLEEEVSTENGLKFVARPIRPEDEPEHKKFLESLSPDDIRFRFFGLVREFPHSQLARFTQIDYDREMAFIATRLDEAGKPETLGVVRAVTDPDNDRAEFAIVVRSDMKSLGMGRALMVKMIRYCQERGNSVMVGQVLPDNRPMLALATALGFTSQKIDDGDAVEVTLDLSQVKL